MTPYSLVDRYQRLGGSLLPRFSLFLTLKMEGLFLFETLVPTYQTTRYDIILIITAVMAFILIVSSQLRLEVLIDVISEFLVRCFVGCVLSPCVLHVTPVSSFLDLILGSNLDLVTDYPRQDIRDFAQFLKASICILQLSISRPPILTHHP